MKFSEIVKTILNENALSQDKLAQILEVSQKSISNWLNGNGMPKANTMLLIYEKFGITPNEIVGMEEPYNFKLLP